jgi:hypothetical protein
VTGGGACGRRLRRAEQSAGGPPFLSAKSSTARRRTGAGLCRGGRCGERSTAGLPHRVRSSPAALSSPLLSLLAGNGGAPQRRPLRRRWRSLSPWPSIQRRQVLDPVAAALDSAEDPGGSQLLLGG